MSVARAIVICVGDELVDGSQKDMNGPLLSRVAEEVGHEVVGRLLITDNRHEIARAISRARTDRIDLLLISGGLGLTIDDLTREGVADGLGTELELDPEALRRISERYSERGRELPPGARRQCMRPEGAQTLPNPVGVAPGFLVHDGPLTLIALPGVPRESEAMLERSVLPALRAAGGDVEEPAIARMLVVGLRESEVHTRVNHCLKDARDIKLGFFAGSGEVEVVLCQSGPSEELARGDLSAAVEQLKGPLGAHLLEIRLAGCAGDPMREVASESDPLVRAVRDAMRNRCNTLAVAESCTGGLLAARITKLAGSSSFFVGGVVAYANHEKEALLGVHETLLRSCGAVSASVARAMAEGCRDTMGADLAISTTGIAGPAGGTIDKPVGLVYVAVSQEGETRVSRHLFPGERESVRRWAVSSALDEARRLLLGLPLLGAAVDE